ncbi:DUF6412 domain-containing protein [Protaetiibacter mangrovi]|uniref:DUF6412 domain-containing protein n=1 Tax=Protaetiibacter mangrovi TaxID=2970926 RepID=A0ABT1ZEB1_9MICO|nr:DUF6412 domain-containing protein [Protaetiibacter mangrovi]MCS0499035.1 DUF6412 domain-containing protein [Protaetiibacter mangrovi]TPX05342.1 hypothetical protein FJ656_07035 [Schumannella luteola]
MTGFLAPLLHGIAMLAGYVGITEPGETLATLGALALVGALAAVVVALVRATLAASPRHLAVGLRARRHAVLLGRLPDASHPDARGHVRSRAPGLSASAA